MDQYPGEKGRDKKQKLKYAAMLFCSIFVLYGRPLFAADEQQPQEEKKIEIEVEKQAIVVKIEHPAIVFPVRWKNPDFPEDREYILRHDFSDEIKKTIDMDNQ